jgi:hypothetical protein
MRRDLSIGIERRAAAPAAGVSVAHHAADLRAAAAGLKQSIMEGTIFLPPIAIALWALTHSYPGIVGDGIIYMGRALADLDPNGVGRDMMFVDDGQTRFSLFPVLLDHLIPILGTDRTALMLATLSMAGWIAALCLLARQFVAPRFIFVVVIFVAVMPVFYGAPWRLGYSEVLAVPRPFAEAIVLSAVAAMAASRNWLAFFCLIVASLIHPLMALAGWGVFGLVLCREDWRWRVAAVLGIVLIFAGAFLGVPVLDRLVTIMDPDLRAPRRRFSAIICPFFSSSKLSFGARLGSWPRSAPFPSRSRRSNYGSGAREATLSLPFSPRRGSRAKPRQQRPLFARSRSRCISGLSGFRSPGRSPVSFGPAPASLRSLGTCVISAAIDLSWRPFLPMGRMPSAISGIAVTLPSQSWRSSSPWFSRASPRGSFGARNAPSPFFSSSWRSAYGMKGRRSKKCSTPIVIPPELMGLIASRNGEVLWIDGLGEAWFLAGRPQWSTQQQGVSSVFSRALATRRRERMQFLIDEGLAYRNAMLSAHVPASADLPRVPPEGIEHLCARADAPAWVIAPIGDGTVIPPEFKPHYWRLAEPYFQMTEETGYYAWHRASAYAVLPCAKS